MNTRRSESKGLVIGVVAAVALVIAGIGCNASKGGSNTPPADNPVTEAPDVSNPSTEPPSAGGLDIGSIKKSEKDGATLVYVPEGEFTMGSDTESSDEKPAHTVYLDAFWIDQTEVTNKQYKACVEAGVCEPPSSIESSSRPNYYGNPEFDDYPVIHVNWDSANGYCEDWAGGDLPTEAQWEKAASWNDLTKEKYVFPWGNDFDGSLANFCDVNCTSNGADKNSNDGYADTAPVGSYSNGASPYSVYDMAGNVWEWVNDWYGENYYYESPPSNPMGPDSGQKHLLRGGSWVNTNNSFPSGARSAMRFRSLPDGSDGIGFRCARGAASP